MHLRTLLHGVTVSSVLVCESSSRLVRWIGALTKAGIDVLSATRNKARSLELATDRRADGFHQIVSF